MLNIAASGGNPTRIAAPVMLMFLRNRLLLNDITVSSVRPQSPVPVLRQPVEELRRAHQRDQQLLESESRLAERGKRLSNGLPIGPRLQSGERVAEELLDDA